MSNYEFEGFQELSKMLEECIDKVEDVTDVLEIGAKEFVNDLLKLPKPISQIRRPEYIHLINSFAYRKKKKEIEVGWGKYYGPMLENGTVKMNEKPHVYPLWERKRERYYKKMITKLGLSA